MSHLIENLKYSALSKTKFINELNAPSVQTAEEVFDNVINESICSPTKNEGISPERYLFKKNLAALESVRNREVEERVQERINRFKDFDKQQERERREQWLTQQKRLIKSLQDQEFLIYEMIERYNKETLTQHQKLDKYYQELAEKQQKHVQEMQMKEMKIQHIVMLFDKIKRNHVEFLEIYQEIVNLIKTYSNNKTIKNAMTDMVEKLRSSSAAMQEIVASCKLAKVTEQNANKSEELVSILKDIKNQIQEAINNQILQEQPKETPPKDDPQPQPVAEQIEIKEVPADTETAVEKDSTVLFDTKKFVSKNNFKIYSELLQFQVYFQNSYSDLLNDASLKKFRQDCMKAINIPVNAISDSNSHHLLDKYDRLKNLLEGKTVMIGDHQINASRHPKGIFYCINLLAVKFVKQSEYLVMNNPNAAFCYAAIIIALWNDFPDFGKLVLAQFYKTCPYLVPFYIPKTSEQSDREFYESRGYLYDDKGEVEKQDKFLKRMTGIVRLYAAILISKPKRSQGKANPHGLGKAWTLLASLMNLEPQYDITATVLHEFLEVTGSTLQNAYGRMFMKLMKCLIQKFMPKLNELNSSGPASRLTVLLEDFIKDGHFKPPNGILPSNFW